MKSGRSFRRTLWGAVLYAAPWIAAAEIEFGADIGYRTDYLRWSIAAPGDAPNIISELTWKDLQSYSLWGHAVYRDKQFSLRGDLGFGKIFRGKNQDSDYAGDDRTLEASRTNNKSNGDQVSDAKLAMGITLQGLSLPQVSLTPLIGISYHVQSLEMTDANQTVSVAEYGQLIGFIPHALGRFSGLDSTYETSWFGPWIGMEAIFPWGERMSLRATYEYHLADFGAKADWNLRADLAHPTSYRQNASGWGHDMNIVLEHVVTENLRISFTMAYAYWKTGRGLARFYFADGNDGYTPLNEVVWRTRFYQVGFIYRN